MNIFYRFPLSFSKTFDKLGRLVAKHPKKIILISIISTIFMSLGTFKIRTETDFGYLIAPTNSRAYEEKQIVDHLFPTNASRNWNFIRSTDLRSLMVITLLPKNGGSVLKKSIFEEAIALDHMINSFVLEWKGEIYNYSDVCMKSDGNCYSNRVLGYRDAVEKINEFSIKYPIDIDPKTFQFNITSAGFGGVTVGDTSDIVEATALRLLYFIDDSDENKKIVAEKWKDEYLKRINMYQLNQTNILKFAINNIDNQLKQQFISAVQCGTVGVLLLGTVCVLSSMTSDWVTSKPTLSVAGCASPILAIIASIGTTAIVSVPFTAFNISIPFIIIGIGVDDMFVLIAAWRRTDRKKDVINRMGETYSHASTSITMTSLTNLIMFIIGATIPVPSTRSLCIQGAFGIFFDWVYQITFFGACLALDGYREEKNLHPVTFTPILSAKDAHGKSWIYRILFTRKSENNEVNPHRLMIWFRDSLGDFMNRRRVKLFIILFFMAYLAGASWGLTTLKSRLNYEDIFFRGSEPHKFAKTYYQLFGKYSQPVHVVVNAKLDYSNRTVQRQVMKIVKNIQSSKYVSRIAMNWLKHFLLFTRINRNYVRSYNLRDPKEFNSCLREVFFKQPMGKIYKNDVIFNEDGVHISTSRFIIIPVGVSEISQEKDVVKELRSIADSQQYSTTLYCMWWLYFEVLFLAEHLILQTLLVATIALSIVFFLFIPHFSKVVCATICIISIELGIIGYMANFGIELNFITALVVVVVIGFCVDSSAHILNSFALSKGTFQERIQQMYFAAGMPILQGTVTTIIGVVPLIILKLYIFQMVVIITCLVMVISFFHAIFVLPTLVSFLEIMMKSIRKTESRISPSDIVNNSSSV